MVARDHRRSSGVQCGYRAAPGKPCPGDLCRTQVAARADRIRPARRRMEIMVPAAELVPGDVVRLSLAGIVAAVKPIRFRQTALDA
jgi:hypothetical protein